MPKNMSLKSKPNIRKRWAVKRTTAAFLIALAFLLITASPRDAKAVEGGAGLYGLGINVPLSGIVPGPGTYYLNQFYFFDQSASIIPDRGLVEIGIKARGFSNIFSLVHVTDWKVLGGNFAVGLYVPLTVVNVDANVRIIPFPILGIAASDSSFGIGDLNVVPAIIGWHGKTWHAKAYFSFFAPTGRYSKSNLANTGRNHWALDFGGGATWLDPRYGLEVSALLGYTVNFTNPATSYRSGDELHLEWHIAQHLPVGGGTISLGLAGYHYQQITGDSGSGALLGGFKGRVMALGPSVNFNNVSFAGVKFGVNFRYMREFAARNRLTGDIVWGTISFKF